MASFIDPLPEAMGREHPSGFATYTLEVLNTAGRGAGLSNQVHVPLATYTAAVWRFFGEGYCARRGALVEVSRELRRKANWGQVFIADLSPSGVGGW